MKVPIEPHSNCRAGESPRHSFTIKTGLQASEFTEETTDSFDGHLGLFFLPQFLKQRSLLEADVHITEN